MVHVLGRPAARCCLLVALCGALAASPGAAAQKCLGPRTQDEFRAAQWGPATNYAKGSRPGEGYAASTGAVNPFLAPTDQVYIQMDMHANKGIDQKKQTYKMEAVIRMVWTDKRLAYNTTAWNCPRSAKSDWDAISTDGTPQDAGLWQPSVTIDNLVSEEEDSSSSHFLVYPDGAVWWERKAMFVLGCSMNFKYYPYDTQTCLFKLRSVRQPRSQVNLTFGTPLSTATVNIGAGVHARDGIVEWELLNHSGRAGAFSKSGSKAQEAGAALDLVFMIKRNHGYSTMYVLIPINVFVFIGWLSFFVDRAVPPARIGMTVFCFAIVMNFMGQTLSRLPRIVGGCWLLTFMWNAFFFNLFAIAEYAACNFLFRIERRFKQAKTKHAKSQRQLKKDEHMEKMLEHEKHVEDQMQKLNEHGQRLEQINSGSSAALVTAKALVKTGWLSDEKQDEEDGLNEQGVVVETASKTKSKARRALGLAGKGLMMPSKMIGRAGNCLLASDGTMALKDEHLDLFCRIAYPVAYISNVVYMYSWLE